MQAVHTQKTRLARRFVFSFFLVGLCCSLPMAGVAAEVTPSLEQCLQDMLKQPERKEVIAKAQQDVNCHDPEAITRQMYEVTSPLQRAMGQCCVKECNYNPDNDNPDCLLGCINKGMHRLMELTVPLLCPQA